MANLTSAVKQHIYNNCPDLTDGACKITATYTYQQIMNTLCIPAVSNYMWKTAACHFWMIKNIINIRARTLWTATRANLVTSHTALKQAPPQTATAPSARQALHRTHQDTSLAHAATRT